MTITVEKLYELCERLDSDKDELVEHQEDYQTIINGAKGGTKEKRLSAQFIVRYFHKLPDQQLRALDALFELCEDEDVNIRKLVIKELPGLCKGSGEARHVDKIADVLTQLLQTEDNHEQLIVQNALFFLLTNYAKEALKTIFVHIINMEEDLIRERAVKFLAVKLKTLPSSVLTKELEDFIITESKKVMQDVSGNEFILLMYILGHLPSLQTVTGRQQLLDLAIEQADLDKSFDANDSDRIDQIIHCFKQALPYLSKNVHSTRMVTFLLGSVVPVMDVIERTVEGAQLELLRVMAELSAYLGQMTDLDGKCRSLLSNLLDVMPTPPSEANGTSDKDLENDDPNVQFSEIEALLFTVHQLGKRHPTLFGDLADDQKKELRKRLQYLARMIQVYSKKVKLVLAKQSKSQMNNDESKLKFLALRTTANISIIIRDLLHSPAQFKAVVSPSWKPKEKTETEKRRFTEVDGGDPALKTAKKEDRSIYSPPEGKYSGKAGAFQDESEYGGGFSYRGRDRGRGRGRGRFGNWH